MISSAIGAMEDKARATVEAASFTIMQTLRRWAACDTSSCPAAGKANRIFEKFCAKIGLSGASANPFSLTPITAGSNDDGDSSRKKLLAAAGQLAGAANERFGSDQDEWNQKIQAMVHEDTDKSWLGKPRAYRLLVPEKKAPAPSK